MQWEKKPVDLPKSLIGPDGADYIASGYAGLEAIYISVGDGARRVYCVDCKKIVARLELRGICYYDVTILAPHSFPAFLSLPGLIDTQAALAIALECCPYQKARQAWRALVHKPIAH